MFTNLLWLRNRITENYPSYSVSQDVDMEMYIVM